jgi:serine/threonine protein kinase
VAVVITTFDSDEDLNHHKLQQEVNILGSISHPNVVMLLGYCNQDRKLLLVYEFIQSGSLENHLFPSMNIINTSKLKYLCFLLKKTKVKPLSWDTRLKIAIN